MLNFEEFQEYAKNHVKENMSKEFENAEVELNTVQKNNGLELHALLVRSEGSNISPTIYLEGFFEKYSEGTDLKEVMSDIGRLSEQHQQGPEIGENIAEKFRDFDFVKDKVIMSVVNAEKNQNLLQNAPHTMKEDLAIIYKVFLGDQGDGMATITIKNDHMDYWGVNTETLHELAVDNSNRLIPATVRGMNEIMMEMLGHDMPPEIAESLIAEMPAENQMYVISNTANVNGAAAMFYGNALEELSESIGSDLYILPSSVHECIAVSTEMGDPEMLAEMVQEVNGSQVSPEEQLSDHVYHYDANTKDITLADTTVEELGIDSAQMSQSMDEPKKLAARH